MIFKILTQLTLVTFLLLLCLFGLTKTAAACDSCANDGCYTCFAYSCGSTDPSNCQAYLGSPSCPAGYETTSCTFCQNTDHPGFCPDYYQWDSCTPLPTPTPTPAPPPANQYPVCNQFNGPTSTTLGSTEDFSFNAFDPDGFISAYTWVAVDPLGNWSNGFHTNPFSWTFTQSGTWIIGGNVLDNNNAQTDCPQKIVTVSAPPPPTPTPTPTPAPNPPVINSLTINSIPAQNANGIFSGRLAAESGSGTQNPIIINLNASAGSGSIREFSINFSGGFQLAYFPPGNGGSRDSCTNGNFCVLDGTWKNISGFYIVPGSYQVEPWGSDNSTNASWRVTFYQNFGSKTMSTSATVTNTNGLSTSGTF